jgi:hypothetical protein
MHAAQHLAGPQLRLAARIRISAAAMFDGATATRFPSKRHLNALSISHDSALSVYRPEVRSAPTSPTPPLVSPWADGNGWEAR